MAHFSSLPTEIYHMILQECNFKTYRTLCLVSKAVHSIVAPYLYREIHWGCLSAQLSKWSCKTLQLVVRSIINNPNLAAHVRSVNLYLDYEYDFDHEEEYLESYAGSGDADAEIYEQAMILLRSIGVDDEDSWSGALQSGNMDAWMAIFLSRLTSLESLTLNPPLVHHAAFTGEMFSHLAESGHLKDLRRVNFGENREGYEMAGLCIPNELVVPLFRLPSLSELELTLTDPMVKSWDTDPEKVSKTLTQLRLYRSYITGDDVDGLLSLTPALRQLHCGFLRDERESDGAEKIDYNRLHHALSRVSTTLETLTIDVRWHEKNCDCFGADLGLLGQLPLPSLAGFRALKELDVPIELLLGKRPWTGRSLVDTLPPGLQSLTLHDERVTWRVPLGSHHQQRQSGDNAMQEIIDALAGYLERLEKHAALSRLVLDVGHGQPFRGDDLVDPGTRRCISAQVEELRGLAEEAQILAQRNIPPSTAATYLTKRTVNRLE
ncbi:hypothetical protein BJY01DRAFT_253706 [Aspergillus pseudoustus]|uniref:F-box domain-containing protein n=1 Tax=Aspergillus pseudoustus TaxID=1810923 RepID=A0ABR4IYH3_9EURO